MAPDRAPVAGFDPRLEGLFWPAGQGGYGIQLRESVVLLEIRVRMATLAPESMTTARHRNEGVGESVRALLARAYELAGSGLPGVDEAARELAGMSGEDAVVISQARRVVLARLRDEPDPATRQVYWLIRRGIELGASRWPWVETNPVP